MGSLKDQGPTHNFLLEFVTSLYRSDCEDSRKYAINPIPILTLSYKFGDVGSLHYLSHQHAVVVASRGNPG